MIMSHMKLVTKVNVSIFALLLGFGLSLALLVNTVTTARNLQRVLDTTRVVLRESNGLIQSMNEMLVTSETLSSAYRDFRESRERADEAMSAMRDNPEVDRLSPRIQQEIEAMIASWDTGASDLLENADESMQAVLDVQLPGRVIRNGLFRLQLNIAGADDVDPGLQRTIRDAQRDIESASLSLSRFLGGRLDRIALLISANAASIVETYLRISLITAGVITVVGLVFVFRLTRGLTKRVTDMQQVMAEMGQRNFAVHSSESGNDELGLLGRDINSVVDSVSEFFVLVRDAVHQAHDLQETLGTSGEQSAAALDEITKNIESIRDRFITLDKSIASSTEAIESIDEKVQGLSTDIQKESSNVDEVSSAIKEMTASIQNISRLTSERKQGSAEIAQLVSEGSEKMQESNETLKSITADIDDILEIIEIINSVSEQTHLLSMNAAIESAHAGEAGRGFAVVAEEIRKLAESASENASRIEGTLRTITGKFNEAMATSNTSTETFGKIQQEVEAFSGALTEIAGSMDELSSGSEEVLSSTEEVSEIIRRLNDSSERMARRTEEIKGAMQDAASVSTEVVGGVSEIDRGAREILENMLHSNEVGVKNREQMDELEQLVSTFSVDVAAFEERRSDEDEAETGEPGDAGDSAGEPGDAGDSAGEPGDPGDSAGEPGNPGDPAGERKDSEEDAGSRPPGSSV